MIDQILQIMAKEDTRKFFTGDEHPSVFDAVSAISNPQDIKEIEKAVKNYFEQVMQISPPSSQIYYEAERMYMVCERMFASLGDRQYLQPLHHETRDLNDEIVDFYIESLKHFTSGLNEDILVEHIRYLDDC